MNDNYDLSLAMESYEKDTLFKFTINLDGPASHGCKLWRPQVKIKQKFSIVAKNADSIVKLRQLI